MPFDSKHIRPLAVALVRRPDGAVLACRCWDKIKQHNFYRLPGGGIEFGETAAAALEREFREEFAVDIKVTGRLDVGENIFTYNGRAGHEIVFLLTAEFCDESLYLRQELPFVETKHNMQVAQWLEITPQTRIYPENVKNFLSKKF